MHIQKLRIPFLILLTILYNAFFWEEKLGINLLLFSTALVGTLFLFNRDALRSKQAIVTGAAVLVTGILVVIHNSGIGKFVHIASVFTFAGFVHQKDLTSILAALGSIFQNYFKAPVELIKSLGGAKLGTPKARKGWAFAKVSIIPLLVLSLFFFIFKAANPRFDSLTANFTENILHAIEYCFDHVSIGRILFALSGAILLTGVIFNAKIKNLLKWDTSRSDEVQRVKKKGRRHFKMLDLKKEFRMGLILLAMVNLLILVVNIIDINWIWFGFEAPAGFNLSQFVHEGTYLLILSILLSMGIMLWVFRANQNFYAKNKWLKWGAYAWIIQNAIMVISVGLRNYYYIDQHGLAYKRIGVIFFLALTLFGLASLFFKIQKGKSGYFLLKNNSWAVFGVMILLAVFNWDLIIVKHNLTHNTDKQIDMPFLLTLSDKALPELEKHRTLLSEEYSYDDRIGNTSEVSELNSRIRYFMRKHESRSWLSWNLADQRAYDFFRVQAQTGAWVE